MKDRKLEQLKKEYMDVPIPQELDFVVKRALKESGIKMTKMKERKKKFSGIAKIAVSIAAAIAIMIVGVNTSPVFAENLSKVPLVGGIVKVLTFREYAVNEDMYNADIKTPAISGLENKNLENSLNKKYLQENEQLYKQFMIEMEDLKKQGGGHLGVDSGYVVKTDTDRILSVGRYVVNTMASSSTTFEYDTLDKQKEILITLPSLFRDDSYVDVISENIKQQMRKQHQADDSKMYWVEGVEKGGLVELFEKIAKEQNFYINTNGKLVISFNKYEVAPGYMGVVEFIIPTEVISDLLVGNEYIN
jgi:hypothetical protein